MNPAVQFDVAIVGGAMVGAAAARALAGERIALIAQERQPVPGGAAQDFAQFLTPDGEFRFGNQPAVHGRADVAAYVAGFFGMIGGSRHEMLRTWEADDSTVCEGLVTYTRLDGAQVTIPFANVFYLRGDKVARYLIFIDNAPLFA